MARSPRLHKLLAVFDVMQTMPSFVYLIPVLMLFGIGKVRRCLPRWCMPLRWCGTALGIRQVVQTLEAAESFGSTRWLLRWVLLPQVNPWQG